ncbi:MAG: hypothetical protein AAGJ68_13750 [Pseudomonadota bacterium]
MGFRAFLGFVSCLCASPAFAEPDMRAPVDLSSPEAAAFSMMRAMYQGDAEMVDQVFLEGGQLRRVSDAGELGENGRSSWRDWVDSLDIGEAHEEIFGVTSEREFSIGLGPVRPYLQGRDCGMRRQSNDDGESRRGVADRVRHGYSGAQRRVRDV